MFNLIASIIPTVIVLGVLIFVHELGHFLACRMSGVKVDAFSIGFGPELLHWTAKGTRFSLSIIPFGGFVKPAGESFDEVNDNGLKDSDYLAQPIPKKMFIVAAGSVMNYILAFVLFFSIFMVGKPTLATVIGDFVEDYPAAEAGLEIGDEIVAVDGIEVETWGELTSEIAEVKKSEIALTVLRDGNAEVITVSPKFEEVKDVFGDTHYIPRVGIVPEEQFIEERYGFFDSLKYSWQTLTGTTAITYKALYRLITGRLSFKNVAGPIGIMALTKKASSMGFTYLMQLTALISATLAVINLIPFPALDGGHLLFLLIGAVRRKELSFKIQEKITQIGYVALIFLMVFVVYNDLVNLKVLPKVKNFFTKAPVEQSEKQK